MKEGLDDLARLWRGARRNTLLFGAAGAAAVGAFRGWTWAASFAIGAAAGYVNFSWIHQMVAAIGPEARSPRRRLYFFLALRYALLGAGGYVIVKVLGMNIIAALVGLFVPIAAIFVESLYELVHGT